MARPFTAPDPRDRSANEPSVMVSSNQVLGFYNQSNKTDKKERVVDSVKDWYVKEMTTNYGWHSAKFHGNQCLLQAKINVES